MIGPATLAALSAIESAEAPLLAWGDTEVSFSRAELTQVVSDAVPGEDAEALLTDLEYGEFLFRVPYLEETRYRSRSAETLRLLTRVRQLFPTKGDPAGKWQTRPRLVRDYRYALSTRRVPRQEYDRGKVLELLQGRATESSLEAVGHFLDEDFRLRGFQLRAAQQILTDLRASRTRGVVVTAGTGGGKTLAFYLPALAHIAALASGKPWVKALAVYPRNELLRDQFASVYGMCRRLDEHQEQHGRRPIRVGTLFQETPYKADSDLSAIGWRKRGDGYVCPMLSCPDCEGALVWRNSDRRAGRERLACESCGHTTTEETLAITRRGMQSQPPDVMFCSAEMVHGTMSDTPYAPLVGVHATRPPRLLLLDEIHTYEGITGAQTAQVLRRWQHLVDGPVEIVGLSATLPNGVSFLAHLAGLDEWQVTPIEVAEDELDDIGSEYVVALRHDPTNRAATLSTTIQALMCLARCLDPLDAVDPVSGGVYGQRIFAFTDRLDVVNRLYADMADAEGYTNSGRPKTGRDSLAALRDPGLDGGSTERARDGQSWELPRVLGHDLGAGPGLRVGRVSSQDPGIDDESSIVAATASLEVGFDDNRAGAVLQHGAPTDMATFIQRKGRAGRPELMRPWTVVVLSDYGKDRRSYQAWDALVDPRPPAKLVPVRNRYVLRMHAVHAMFEWVAARTRGTGFRARFDLAAPSTQQWYESWKRRVSKAEELLEGLLEDPALQASLQDHVAKSLKIAPEEAAVLMWESPRPLLLAAVPTLLRRLETDWFHGDRGPRQDLNVGRVPLPDFISRTLFESLESPDVDVEWPARFKDENERATMNFETLLREFVPGNASRRFGFKGQDVVHWVPVSRGAEGPMAELDLPYPDVEAVGELPIDGGVVALVQPRRAVLSDVPPDLGDRVRSRPVWSTRLTPQGESRTIGLDGTEVKSVLPGLAFYLHVDGAAVDLARGVYAADVEWPTGSGETERFRAPLRRNGESVAVGTRFLADAVAVHVAIPDDVLALAAATPEMERATRSSWFAHRIQTDERLLGTANIFQLQWIHDAVLATIAQDVVEHDQTVDQVLEASSGSELVLRGLDLVLEASDAEEGSPDSRLRDGLADLVASGGFADAVHDVAQDLTAAIAPPMQSWLERRFHTTVVTAALAAAELVASEHSSGECVADIAPHVGSDGEPTSWLTERSPGGAGFLEQVRIEVEEDPRRFARVVRSLLMPGPDARVDRDLRTLLTTSSVAEVWAALEAFRRTAAPRQRRVALEELRQRMRRSGLAPTAETVSGVIARVGRPGTDRDSDEAARELATGWVDAETRLGFELDLRVWAGLGRRLLERRGMRLPGPADARAQLDAALSVLWPRGWQREADRLSVWNPFEAHLPTYPSMVLQAMSGADPHVRVPGQDVLQLVRRRLRQSGTCRVAADRGAERELASLLLALSTSPIDVGGLFAYARVADVSVTGTEHVVSVELRDGVA